MGHLESDLGRSGREGGIGGRFYTEVIVEQVAGNRAEVRPVNERV